LDGRQLSRYLRYLGIALAILTAGVLGLALIFLDFGVATTPSQRTVIAALYFFAAGALCAVLGRGKRVWLWAGLVTWATTTLGFVGLLVSLANPESADLPLIIKLFGPVPFSLTGAVAGRLIRGRPHFPSPGHAPPARDP
jgi:peptidoglycan/LPS O-acetylase OafA/YrhL